MDYDKLYRIIGDKTPLKSDCGVLCGSACCKGDAGTGMLLFPGEKTNLNVIRENGVKIAVCNGICDRESRPLSCRIFPLFPVMEDGKIRIIPDLRGSSVCPLVANSDYVRFNKSFLRRLKKAGRILYSDRKCAEFCRGICDDITCCENIMKLTGDKNE